MNSDIRLETGFRDNLKIDRLESALGGNGVIALLRLWCYVAVHRCDGTLPGWSAQDLARASRWRGQAERLASTLVQLGFLHPVDSPPGGYQVHEWKEHQAYVANAPNRSVWGKEGAKRRWEKKLGYGQQKKPIKPIANSLNAPRPRPRPTPRPTPVPDPKTQTPPTPSNGTMPAVVFHIPKSIVKALDDIPRWGQVKHLRDPTWWQPHVRAYDIEFAEEMAKADAWLTRHPERRLKKPALFLGNWFAKAAEIQGEQVDAHVGMS